MGWRRGCLAAGLVRCGVHHYCLGGCSALFVPCPGLVGGGWPGPRVPLPSSGSCAPTVVGPCGRGGPAGIESVPGWALSLPLPSVLGAGSGGRHEVARGGRLLPL